MNSKILVQWSGDLPEFYKLRQAIDNNCGCPDPNPENKRCPAHAMLLDQRVMDHLAFVKDRLAIKIQIEERTR